MEIQLILNMVVLNLGLFQEIQPATHRCSMEGYPSTYSVISRCSGKVLMSKEATLLQRKFGIPPF